MDEKQKPHGLELGMDYEILNPDGSVAETSKVNSELQGYLEIQDNKTGKTATLPMRSFVNGFINSLHGIMSADGGTDTFLSTVDPTLMGGTKAPYASLMGMLTGIGQATPSLGDSSLVSKLYHASLNYGIHNLVSPNFSAGALNFEVKRTLSNNKATNVVIGELGNFKAPVASSASLASWASKSQVITLISRDIFGDEVGGIEGITLERDTDIRFTFKLKITQDTSGNGGAVLNLVKMIYNMMIAGNVNNTNSQLTTRLSAPATLTWTRKKPAKYASSFNTAFYIKGSDSQPYIGIVVGYMDQEGGDNPPITADDHIMQINHTNLTVGENTVSVVTNPSSGVAQFTIQRLFTNSSSTQYKYIDRIGLLIKGSADGVTLGSDQCFVMMNRPSGSSTMNPNSIMLQPSQILRITFSFKIKVI